MLLSRNSLAVSGVCASNAGRFALHAVHVLPDGTTEASDGRRLLRYAPIPDMAPAPADFPCEEGKVASVLPAPVLIAADDADMLRKRTKLAKRERRTILSSIVIDGAATATNGHVACVLAPNVMVETVSVRKVDSTFPPTASVIPATDGRVVARVAIDLMIGLLSAMKDAGAVHTTMSLHADSRVGVKGKDQYPVRFDAADTGGEGSGLAVANIVGVLMPVSST